MRVHRLLFGVLLLTATIVSANTGPSIEVRSIFLHGREYPGVSHHLQLRLESESDKLLVETRLSPFSEYAFDQPFMLPAQNGLRFAVHENGTALLDIVLKIYGNNIETMPTCKRLPDLDKVFPYKGFSSYVPPGTIVVGCNTQIGRIEIQLRCRNETSAVACGSE